LTSGQRGSADGAHAAIPIHFALGVFRILLRPVADPVKPVNIAIVVFPHVPGLCAAVVLAEENTGASPVAAAVTMHDDHGTAEDGSVGAIGAAAMTAGQKREAAEDTGRCAGRQKRRGPSDDPSEDNEAGCAAADGTAYAAERRHTKRVSWRDESCTTNNGGDGDGDVEAGEATAVNAGRRQVTPVAATNGPTNGGGVGAAAAPVTAAAMDDDHGVAEDGNSTGAPVAPAVRPRPPDWNSMTHGQRRNWPYRNR
jgi:hypothetical protein